MNYVEKIEDLFFNITELQQEYQEHIQTKKFDDEYNENSVLFHSKFVVYNNGWNHEVLNPMSYTKSVIEQIQSKYKINNIVYRILPSNSAYYWHTDSYRVNIHIPLITNEGSWMVFTNKAYHMANDGSAFFVRNGVHHTFVNSGHQPRCHLIFAS
jgi:hypothetical protein